ncbi:hypothetical protein Avbf_17425, partial [Armadillidium vulgare]
RAQARGESRCSFFRAAILKYRRSFSCALRRWHRALQICFLGVVTNTILLLRRKRP